MAKDVFGIVGTTQAGSFRVESVVAEGGFAVVYRAQHEQFRAPVALKCLKVPEGMSPPERELFLDKFREEGELMFLLSAQVPAVVRPLHVDVLALDDGRFVPFLALEWLDGEGLDVIIHRRAKQGRPPIDATKLVVVLTPVAEALACAHRFPGPGGTIAIIHRDLKPENIFVARTQAGEAVKILDYGVARARSEATLRAGRVTAEGVLEAFTPGYAAPEQWLPKRFGQAGPWTDVWGLALTMVEALSGKPAIDGDLAATMGTAIDEARRPTPRAEGATVSDEVEAAFARALAVDPRQRTQSIEAFWTELEAALGLEPTFGPEASRRGPRFDTGPPAPVRFTVDSQPTLPAPLAPQMIVQRSPMAMSISRGVLAPRFSAPPAPPVSTPPVSAPPVSAPRPAPSPKVNALPKEPAPEVPLELAFVPRKTAPPELEEPPRSSAFSAHRRAALRLPLLLLLTALALRVGDTAYTRFTGETLHVGPARPSWIAAPMVLLGFALGYQRLRRDFD